MEDLESGSYGDAFADVYDRWYPDVTDVDACVERLAALAPGGSLLELGVGTGRLALPLAARGLTVSGVDSSAAMLRQLAAKPGAPAVRTHLADMADLDAVDELTFERFDLVLIAYNTLFNLPDEAAQARCLDGAAERLDDGGRLVVEAFVPGEPLEASPGQDRAGAGTLGRLDDLGVSRLAVDEVVLTATVHDAAPQTVEGQHIQITERGIRLRPWRVRYLHPDQLDAMAASAGLHLVDRASDWTGAAFDEDSSIAISIYQALATG